MMRAFVKSSKGISLLLIFIIGFLAYSNSFHNSFQFDDTDYIVNNRAIRNPLDLKSIWSNLGYPTRIIGLFSFSLNYLFNKYDVVGYHIVNFAIHFLSSAFLFFLVLLLFETPFLKDSSAYKNKLQVSLFAALIFIAHPIQTQAVTYITQRFASLAAMFYLLSMFLYVKARLNNNNVRYFISAGLSGICAMFTKENAFTLPFAVLLVEHLFFHYEGINRKTRMYLITAGILLALLVPLLVSFKFSKIFGMHSISGSHDGDVITVWKYAITQFRVITKYLQLIFVPIGQNIDHDFALSTRLFDIEVLASAALIIFLIYLGFRSLKENMLIGFGILFFFLTLSIESSIIPIRHVIFEHRVYLPMAGASIVISTLIFSYIKEKKNAYLLSVVIICILSFLTFQRNKVWKTDLSLWSDAVRKSPFKSRAQLSLGYAYSKRGQDRLALKHINKALTINPSNYKAYNGRGVIYERQGLYSLAFADYKKALHYKPNYPEVYYNLGNMFNALGKKEEALKNYNKVLSLNPYYLNAYINRGNTYVHLKDYDSAFADYKKALDINSESIEALYSIGNIYGLRGKYDLAVKYYNKVIKLDTDFAAAYYSKGNAFELMREYKMAIDLYRKTMSLEPKYLEAYNHMALCYAKMNKFKEAIDAYNSAIRVEPRYLKAYIQKADIYFTLRMYDHVISVCDQMLKFVPDDGGIYYVKSRAYYMKGDFGGAMYNALKARDLGAENEMPEYYISEIRMKLDEQKGIK